jgi:hypothetical protein
MHCPICFSLSSFTQRDSSWFEGLYFTGRQAKETLAQSRIRQCVDRARPAYNEMAPRLCPKSHITAVCGSFQVQPTTRCDRGSVRKSHNTAVCGLFKSSLHRDAAAALFRKSHNTAVCGLFKSSLHRDATAALFENPTTRQCVDRSSPAYIEMQPRCLENPTTRQCVDCSSPAYIEMQPRLWSKIPQHGSVWIVQVQPTLHLPDPIAQSPFCSARSAAANYSSLRTGIQELKRWTVDRRLDLNGSTDCRQVGFPGLVEGRPSLGWT